MKYFLSFFLFLSISTPSYAYEFYIRGNQSCDYINDIAKNDSAEFNRYVYWLGGFLSGYNFKKNTTIGEGVNIGCIAGEVKKFCKMNKELTLGDGIASIISDIENPFSDLSNSDWCKL